MQEKNPLADGMYFDRPKEGAPDFVKGRLSIKADKAIAMINQYKNEKDYVNLDLLQSKDGTKLYLVVNTWKPTNAPGQTAESKPAYPQPDGDVPF